MKNALLLALCALATALASQAQEMKVIRVGGQVDEFALSAIDSVTFALPGAPGKSIAVGGQRSTHDILLVHTASGTQQFPVATIDSLGFGPLNVMTIYQPLGVTSQFSLVDVDSLTFISGSMPVVTVTYNGTSATVDNPLADSGVAIAVTGADVTVTATAGLAGITYLLSGSTADGVFKIYSDSDLTLRLDGVAITNSNQPAVNVQANHAITVELAEGTANVLTDGVTYATAPNGEDQKGAFFSEGELLFTGTGSLTVNGRGSAQHGLASDNFVAVDSGSLTVASAVRDGIHTNAGYFQPGGAVVVTGGYDGVDGGSGPVEIGGGTLSVLIENDDRDAVKCSGAIRIAGGELELTVAGDQSKGLNAPDILLTGGTLAIETSGGVVLETSGLGFDPAYCTAIKGDNLVLLAGCQLTISTTGIAGRGISCDGDIAIESGSVSVTSSGGGGVYTDPTGLIAAYHGPCLNADADVLISGGTVTLSHSGSGGKGIAGDGDLSIGTAVSSPALQVTTSGAPINIGGGEYAEAKAISVDSLITIDGGQLTVSSPDDAIKSKYWIEINAGLINVVSSKEGIESPNIFINGGELHINSTDDGLNATYGEDVEFDDGSVLTLTGGYVHVNAPAGDGVDSNGDLTIGGGTLIVHGPPNQPEVGLDVNGTFLENGGLTVVSQINSGMNEVPSGSSAQRSVLLRSSSTISGGVLFHIETLGGASLLTFRPARNYSAILLSTPDLISGTTYRVYTGGSCTGTEQDGLYTGGSYSGGSLRTTFTSSGMVQTVTF